LANDIAYWRQNSAVTDRYNLATDAFGTHVAISTLAKQGASQPLAFLGAGLLSKAGDADQMRDRQIDSLVRSDPNTWMDVNVNFQNDENEPRQVFDLAFAVTLGRADEPDPQTEGRIAVLSDSDMLSTIAVTNTEGNQTLFLDLVHWLSGEEDISGTVNSEEDVRITHTRKEDTAWFYSTIFLFPSIIIGSGFAFTRKRRMGRSREARHAAGVAASTPASSNAASSASERHDDESPNKSGSNGEVSS
jgi:hypothetical protein